MAEWLRLDIEPPANGWAIVRLTAFDIALEFAASYTPRDTIGDLTSVATGVAAGVPEQVVTWHTEPIEYEFRFATADGRTRLEVREFPDSRRQRGRGGDLIAEIEGNAVAVARSLWRGLRRLQGTVPAEEFAVVWRHEFPTAAVERLAERLREHAASERLAERLREHAASEGVGPVSGPGGEAYF